MSQSGTTLRQRAWDRLREGQADSVSALAIELGHNPSSLARWARALTAAGYLLHQPLRLVRDTGPIVPIVTDSGEVHDHNLSPPVDAARLRAAVERHEGSASSWLRRHGLGAWNVTKLKEMMAGKRPVWPMIARIVEADEGRLAPKQETSK